jgi:beta-phosphoglucomutase family hydrolase
LNALGLPGGITACLFDLDGVLTPTALIHAQAWKRVFDDFLRVRSVETGEAYKPFDEVHDYDEYVDGKPRADGVRSFLESRRITLPEASVDEVAERKDRLFLQLIQSRGVEPYPGSLTYLRAVRDARLKTAVVSSSKHCTDVLQAAGMHGLLDTQVDGNVAQARRLNGKPAPDTYLEAARMLGVEAAQAAVFEDALAGVAAGRAGSFGFVVGVDRAGQAEALREHGADVVVADLADLLARP